MAIDLKELRIGSHVEVIGVRVRVDQINRQGIGNFDPRMADGYEIEMEHLAPIPITPELLTELGFEYRPVVLLWRKEQTDTTPFIGFDVMHNGMFRMTVSDDTMVYGNIVCKYLHEAEAFLYLTTKQELIND